MKTQQREKILAAHFAATNQDQPTRDFEAFVHWMQQGDKSEYLKQWWDEMDALRVLRRVNHLIQYSHEQIDREILELPKIENQTVTFKTQSIGKIYNYQRIVLPQEMQIKIAYDSLIERFLQFLQQEKYVIRLFENAFTISLFVPYLDFQLEKEWERFIQQSAYSEKELYKSFTLLVNSLKLTDRGFGYVRFPPATKMMAHWLAAFYIATLRERILRNADNYRNANTALSKAQENVKRYQDQLKPDNLTERRRANIESKLCNERENLNEAKQALKSALRVNQAEFNKILSGLRDQTNTVNFDHAEKLSRQFNRTGSMQFSYGTVKLKSQGGKSSIEDTIIEILNEPIALPSCPFVPLDTMPEIIVRNAGDNAKNLCYSCGRTLPAKERHQQANRFVLGDPSQRLQSGGSQAQPNVCGECLTVAFACPVKLTSGAIVVQLAPRDEIDQPFSIENQLRMLTLGELNLVAGRYLLINCREFAGSGNSRILVSEKIGQVQYTLWRVACTLPAEALGTMKFTLFTGGAEIPLKTRHLVWLSLLNKIFSPDLIVEQRDNIPLGQAIRLIEKDEVIAAIYKMVTVDPDKREANQLWATSYREKRVLEELREKHCILLEQLSEKGEKPKMNQARLFRHVAGLTGLTYAYCDYVRSEVNKDEKLNTEREVSKLIEQVTNPNFFNYAASEPLTGTRATMFRNDDNYFCYDQAKCLLTKELNLDLSSRVESISERGQLQLSIYFDDILNAYTTLFENYYKSANEQRKLCYQLKLSLYAKFASLFQRT